MASHNATADDILFAARLTPYRSLSNDGFRLLMGFIGTICFVVGVVFAIAGVWPILGFMGFDFLLIYWAFKSNYASARAYEDVEVSRQHVALTKVSARGRETRHQFPQFGTRLELDRHDEIGITQMRLANRQRAVPFGYFLNPADRESFATALARALSRAKR